VCVLAAACAVAAAQKLSKPFDTLVWSDEFNKLDFTKVPWRPLRAVSRRDCCRVVATALLGRAPTRRAVASRHARDVPVCVFCVACSGSTS
jgi:hypothetical protein